MLSKLSNSWQLVKASAKVLNADKELLIFPLLSGIAAIVVTASFFLPMTFVGGSQTAGVTELMGYVLGFLFYFCQYFVVIFFNTALVGAALIRLDGGNPTLADGLRTSFSRISQIVKWALLASTVGLLLRMARERAGFIGKMVVGLVGLAWGFATFLVVPVLVVKGLGPIDAVKESSRVLKKTWGEQIAGNVGLGAVFMAAYAIFAIFAFGAIILASTIGQAVAIVPIVIVLGVILLTLILTQSALTGIYTAALYRYATTGDIGVGFDSKQLQGAFTADKR